ncbi:hypothetical protein [Halalkalicoccus ordinarius]
MTFDIDSEEDRKRPERLEDLEGLEEGAGCVEIWEALSERRSGAESTED